MAVRLLRRGAGAVFVLLLPLALVLGNLHWMLLDLSFANDLWQLDPRTDYLVRMVPQGFWLGATV